MFCFLHLDSHSLTVGGANALKRGPLNPIKQLEEKERLPQQHHEHNLSSFAFFPQRWRPVLRCFLPSVGRAAGCAVKVHAGLSQNLQPRRKQRAAAAGTWREPLLWRSWRTGRFLRSPLSNTREEPMREMRRRQRVR